jgi:hypothetical protein
VKVGDLVRRKRYASLGLGIVLDFDVEGDPIVYFQNRQRGYHAFYSDDLEVVNEGRRRNKTSKRMQ